MIEEVLYRPYIRCNGVLCQIGLGKIIFEFCYHMPLIYNEYSNNIRECVGHYVHVLLTNPPSGMAVLMYPAIQHGERNNVKYIREQNITTIFQTDTNIFRFRYGTGRPPALRRAKRFPRRISPITATVPICNLYRGRPLSGWKGVVTTKVVAKNGEQEIVLQSNSKTSYYYEGTGEFLEWREDRVVTPLKTSWEIDITGFFPQTELIVTGEATSGSPESEELYRGQINANEHKQTISLNKLDYEGHIVFDIPQWERKVTLRYTTAALKIHFVDTPEKVEEFLGTPPEEICRKYFGEGWRVVRPEDTEPGGII